MNDLHADLMAGVIDVVFEDRIGHAARDGIEGDPSRREVGAAELPVAEVSGDDDQPLSTGQCLLEQVPSFDALDTRDDLLAGRAGQDGGFERRPSEALVRPRGDVVDLGRRAFRKSRRDLPRGDAAANAQRPVRETGDPSADPTGRSPAHQTQRPHHQAGDGILQSVRECGRAARCSFSHARWNVTRLTGRAVPPPMRGVLRHISKMTVSPPPDGIPRLPATGVSNAGGSGMETPGLGVPTTSAQRLTQLGLVINALLAVVKLVAGLLGNAYALVADAIESSIDMVGSLVVWGGLRIASRDPDERYPFGYGRAEAIAGAVVGALMLGAAAGIAIEAIGEIRTPHHAPALTLGVLALVIVIKELLAKRVLAASAETGSVAVAADAGIIVPMPSRRPRPSSALPWRSSVDRGGNPRTIGRRSSPPVSSR